MRKKDDRQLLLPGLSFAARSARAELQDHLPHQVRHRGRSEFTSPPAPGAKVNIVWLGEGGAEVLVPAVYLSCRPGESGMLCNLALDLEACASERIFSPSLMAFLPRRFSDVRVKDLRKRSRG